MNKPRKGNTDAKSVSSKQSWEPAHICKVFEDSSGTRLKSAVLKQVMKNLGKNGKPSRSRRSIYIALRGMGYFYVKPKKK